MKKVLLATAFLALLFPFLGKLQAVFADSATHIYLDGKELPLSGGKQVLIANNSVLVPIRIVVEQLGYAVDWDSKDSRITVANTDKNIVFTLDNPKAVVNNTEVPLISAPVIKANTAYIPLRFVGEQMGLTVYWDNTSKSVMLTTQQPSPPSGPNGGQNESSGNNAGASAPSNSGSGQTPAAANALLKGIDFTDNKLILSVDRDVKPSITTLTNPDRIAVDLPNTYYDTSFLSTYSLGQTLQGQIPVSGYPNVSGIRFSVFSNNPPTLRIVLDLNAPSTFTVEQTGGQIAVDLSSGSGSATPPPSLPSSNSNALGIDVSHHNGTIDWNQVAAGGYSFVYIKASEGKTFRDNLFMANLSGAKAAGLLTGAYHFLDATTPDNARLEADNFADTLFAYGALNLLDLPPVLDYEDNPGKLTGDQINAVAAAFLDEFEARTGLWPMIYSGNLFAANFNASLSAYKLWIANYNTVSPSPVKAWSNWTIWQFTQSGTVPGITGKADLNQYNGTLDDLRANLLLAGF